MKCYWSQPLALGEMTLVETDGKLTEADFGAYRPQDATEERTPLLDCAIAELTAYLAGERREFDLPLAPAGTAFQQSVWSALRTIPYGETASYGQIAARIGNPKSCRAVGMANNRNPLPIFIPCHRVIGADGSLIGYGGGLAVKQWLLELERRVEQSAQELSHLGTSGASR